MQLNWRTEEKMCVVFLRCFIFFYSLREKNCIYFLLLARFRYICFVFGNARALEKPDDNCNFQIYFRFVVFFRFSICDSRIFWGNARARSLLIVRYFLNFDGSLFVCDWGCGCGEIGNDLEMERSPGYMCIVSHYLSASSQREHIERSSLCLWACASCLLKLEEQPLGKSNYFKCGPLLIERSAHTTIYWPTLRNATAITI